MYFESLVYEGRESKEQTKLFQGLQKLNNILEGAIPAFQKQSLDQLPYDQGSVRRKNSK